MYICSVYICIKANQTQASGHDGVLVLSVSNYVNFMYAHIVGNVTAVEASIRVILAYYMSCHI